MEVHVFAEPGVSTPIWVDGRPVEPEEFGLAPAVAGQARAWVDLVVAAAGPPLDAGGPYQRGMPYDEQAALLGSWVANRVRDAAPDGDVTYHAPGRAPVVVPSRDEREPVRLRIFPEWGDLLPVWGAFVSEAGVGALPGDLAARLTAWNDEWQRSVDETNGDRIGGADPDGHVERGAALAAEVAEALGPDYDVAYEGGLA